MYSSYGGIRVANGPTTQILTTTPALLINWLSNQDVSSNYTGDTSVVPDFANSRVRVKPGIYKVELSIEGITQTGARFTFQLYDDNGALPGGRCSAQGSNSSGFRTDGQFGTIVDLRSRVPDAAGYVNLQIYGYTDSGNPTFQIENADFTAFRLDV